MSQEGLKQIRSNSSSTIRASKGARPGSDSLLTAILWTHDETVSSEHVLFRESWLAEKGIREGTLVVVRESDECIEAHDFQPEGGLPSALSGPQKGQSHADGGHSKGTSTFLCYARSAKKQEADLSMSRSIANTFNFTARSRVTIERADLQQWTATHIELCFRDAYLSRSDMWRFTCQSLVGRVIYVGQKLSVVGSLKATVQSIHVNGDSSSAALFTASTVPIFRSEAARYVIFIQMSREMWDFDSEGNGEIMFNRVVNGFLPELFKKWSTREVRHLVSIILFGRLEYEKTDMHSKQSDTLGPASTTPLAHNRQFQDFYRVVVTDMASAQWTTILDELKKDFRVYLRDVSLFERPQVPERRTLREDNNVEPSVISGRLSTALKGNILEAINLAASQFSNDYIDRDLIRTGISTVIVTAGTGVFDVDRDLLDLTSETLTNNGIGIDIVCLSKMPLHTVPLFRYRLPHESSGLSTEFPARVSPNSSVLGSSLPHPSLPDLSNSPAFSATASTSLTYFSRFPSAFPAKVPQPYGYGIPQWIDLSYWSPAVNISSKRLKDRGPSAASIVKVDQKPFEPRVRMYEVQMMGLMEMGMADIAIGYLQDEKVFRSRVYSENRIYSQSGRHRQGLSRSPELDRKSLTAPTRSQDYSTYSPSDRIKINQALNDMQLYDESVYDFRSAGDSFSSLRKISSGHPKSTRSRAQSPPKDIQDDSPVADKGVTAILKSQAVHSGTDDFEKLGVGSTTVADISKPRRPAKISRNLSSAFRKVALKATAVTPEVNMETVNAQAPPTRTLQQVSRPSTPVSAVQEGSNLSKTMDEDQEANPLKMINSAISKGEASINASKPIKIRTRHQDQGVPDDLVRVTTDHTGVPSNSRLQDDSHSPKAKGVLTDDRDEHASVPNSIPESQIPFIRNVNASNPLKHQAHAAAIGRWQHLYPRRPQDTIVKWRSLCMPASVPLTTEDFPTSQDFEHQWVSVQHVLEVGNSYGTPQERQNSKLSLLLELLSVRLAHGYQFVVGNTVKQTLGTATCDRSLIFNPIELVDAIKPIVMIMGNTVQKLDISKPGKLTITKYARKSDMDQAAKAKIHGYEPYVRTILADAYLIKPLVLRGSAEQYPWELADNHLQCDRKQQDEVVEELRFWRARFVLIPVEPPANTLKQHQNSENDEEIHLLGIRALTQLWLKNKYVSPEDKESGKARTGKNVWRDQKPLEVKMETLNPSELVAAELDRLLHHDDNGDIQTTQLLPESQKLDRDSSIQKIAQLLQTDHGIEIKNRRWHWRLHYNCFRGEELVNWLLENVMDIETRDEAVEMGNELMKEGLFEHVNGRHNFKDGHYFYSMKNEFKQLRTEQQRSWFPLSRQTNRSIPPTPATEQPDRELSPSTGRITSTSNLMQQLTISKSTGNQKPITENQRKTVSLSRMIRVDVDPRKKSYFGRQEVVNIHYDRFHSPENCYHLELDWLNTTCKLIDDAIVTWTNTAEKFGLKLVEVPIAEAFEVPKYEPFRSPYRIKLALEPPKQKSSNNAFNNVFFTATSFAPQQTSPSVAADKHIYQKAILKRFNFVLDLEAASEFPEGVDIRHSWGRLDYKYTQFVHRSGVLLAQILDDGDIIVLANRLYNSRLANTKDVSSRMLESRKEGGPQSHRPAVPPTSTASMQASGIVGINLASPSGALPSASSPWLGPSPVFKSNIFSPLTQIEALPIPILADTFGPKAAKEYSQYITPEQIKDDLLTFCSSETMLEQFYREVTSAQSTNPPGSTNRRTTGSGSSSLLKPVREVPGATSDIAAIPAFELPESISAISTLRRATVAYENANEMMGRVAARVGLEINSTLAVDTTSKPSSQQEGTDTASTDSSGTVNNNLLSANGLASATQATRARATSTTRTNVQSSPLRKATT